MESKRYLNIPSYVKWKESQASGNRGFVGTQNALRLRKALHEEITVIPDLTLMQKDHKKMDESVIPKTRPVCEARCTYNQRANGHLAAILGAVIEADPSTEAISTEDAISRLDSINKKIQSNEISPRNQVVGSLDVESLYPSIDTKSAGIICRDRVKNSRATVEGVDYHWALKYLAVTMKPVEVVDAKIMNLLPRRVNPSGRKSKPGISTAAEENNHERWRYPKPPSLLTKEEKKLIMGCITQQLVKLVFDNHFYMWDNEIFHQQGGCPMGVLSSSPVSRIVMDDWQEKMKEMEDKMDALARINPVAYERLDVFLITYGLLGIFYQLVISEICNLVLNPVSDILVTIFIYTSSIIVEKFT